MTTPPITHQSAQAIPAQAVDPSREQTIQRALLRAYVHKNYEKYQRMWDKAKSSRTKQSWNWAAFFLSFAWFAYRKMYVVSAVWIALILAETIASMVFSYPERYSSIFSLALAFGAGHAGNTIYVEHANRQVNQVKATLPSSHWVRYLRSKGGVSWSAGMGAFVLLIAMLLLVSALGGKL